MAITIVIPTALRQFAGGKTELTVEASTVGAAGFNRASATVITPTDANPKTT